MRILIISQYFWPENFIISDVAVELASKGHQITVLTSKPNYPDGKLYEDYKKNTNQFNAYKNIKIIRVLTVLRRANTLFLGLNYFFFAINSTFYSLFKIKKDNFDLVFSFQPSPIFSAFPSLVIKYFKKIPYLIWVQDLWPDTLAAVGFNDKTLLYKAVSLISQSIYSNAEVILSQSRGIKNLLILRNINKAKIYLAPNYNPVEISNSVKEYASEFNKNLNSFNIIFAGNHGTAQDLPSVLKAILALKNDESIKWHFIGNGRMLPWLKNEIKNNNLEDIVFTYGNYPIEKIHSFLNHADCLLLSLKNKDIFSITIPAKLQFYLATGKPILGMINGEAAKIIKDSKSGIACKASNYLALAENINILKSLKKKDLAKMGQNGILYSNKFFNKNEIINNIEYAIKATICTQQKKYFINTSQKPKFLILLAAFNGIHYLSDQIKSILNQRDVEIEILINVDKSSDGSENLCRNFSKADPRVKILKCGRIYGNASSNFIELFFNIKQFKFDYVSLSDQDDIWDNDKLIRAHILMKSSKANCYSSDVFAFWESGKKVYLKKSYPFKRYDFLFESAGPGCTYVLDKKIVQAFLFFISNSQIELINKVLYHDWFIYAFARKNNFKWIIDSRASMLYRQHNLNVIGARFGFNAYLIRVLKILAGVGFSQHVLIANLIGIKNKSLILNNKRNLFLGILTPYKFRRKFTDQCLFSIICLIFIFRKNLSNTKC